MDNKLYKMMNWPEIESIIYSECDHPHEILGRHSIQGGTLIQCFFYGASKVFLKGPDLKNDIQMTQVDEEGFFAYWTSDKNFPDYEYEVKYEDGRIITYPECYLYLPRLEQALIDKFYAGILYDMYSYLGAFEEMYKNTRGTSFLVYAPMALRVSVVGDFNGWDGRLNQMSRLGETGIFAIFIPNVTSGSIYKYEIKLRDGMTYLKRDPFSRAVEDNPNKASRVAGGDFFIWTDEEYMAKENTVLGNTDSPLSFKEIMLKNYLNDQSSSADALNLIKKTVKDYGYDAVILDNITKEDNKIFSYSLFAFNGYESSDIKFLVNGLHKEGIPVIFTLDLSSFYNDNEGLKGFDGRKLYEAADDREIDQNITFDFSKKYVRNYLISAAFHYIQTFHFDGLVLRSTDRILYHNFKRAENDHTTNIYGGVEDLGGEELIKHLNSVIHKKYPGIITIAGDSLNSNLLTTSLDDGGFGFDYKFDNHLHESMYTYFKQNPAERVLHYNDLTNVLINSFAENFIVLLPYNEYGNNEKFLIDSLEGDQKDKFKNFRLMLTALYTVPGRKCLPFDSFEDEGLVAFLKDLQNLYKENPALHELNNDEEGFEWLDTTDPGRSSVTFLRIGHKKKVMVSFNFSDESKTVILKSDKKKTYNRIFDSNDVKYGGDVKKVAETVNSVKDKENAKHFITKIALAPFSASIFECAE